MTNAGTCIFLNGLPGSGKSTYARSFVASRRGWLNLDVDVLRGLLGTTSVDFVKAGAEVRPLALAVLREQISSGGNVLFPQLFFTPDEAEDFESTVVERGGSFHRTMLYEDPRECWRRVSARAHQSPDGSMERGILRLLEASGGLSEVERMEQQLSAWFELPDPPFRVSATTPHEQLEALARHSRVIG